MTRHSILAVSVGLVLAILSAAQAADAPAKATAPSKPTINVISVTIHPAAEPKPALKYHLLPTFLESTPGDAVPLYAKALVSHIETCTSMRDDASYYKSSSSDLHEFPVWLETPLDKLPRDRVRRFVSCFDGIGSQLDLAARREHCNWDMPLREGHVFEIPLRETQEFRDMARIVALRARLQTAEGKYDEALASLQTGYGMARHIAEQPLLIGSLFEYTITGLMNDQLLTLCQQPGAPNLYWSLAELPSPWIDRRKSILAEYDGVYLQWPELQAVRHAQYVPEQWSFVLRKVVSEMVRFEDNASRTQMSDKERAAKIEKVIARALGGASRAKTELLATGHAPKDVDRMPPAQIVLLHTVETYDRFRDDLLKWWHLLYWQAHEGLEAAERNLDAANKQELIPMPWVILPAVSAALDAFACRDRQLAAIRCIEALRLYAAAHDGELPATLDEIKEVPIPLNPVTGKPFPYRLDGAIAVLDADGGPASQPRPQYRITVAKQN